MTEAAEQLDRKVFKARVGVETFVAPAGALSSNEINDELHQVLTECIEDGEYGIIVDLADVPQINSRAIEILLDTQDLLLQKGGRLKVVGAGAVVLESLQITGFVHYVPTQGQEQLDPLREASATYNPLPLGELLVRKELISQEQVEEALRAQKKSGKRLGEIVTERGWLEERQVLQALAEQLDVPMVRLRAGVYDPETVAMLDHDTAKRLKVLPLFRVRGVVALATANPQDMPSLTEIEDRLQATVRPIMARAEDILKCLEETSDELFMSEEFITEVDADFEVVENLATDDYTTIDEMAAGSPIINLVNSLIQRAIHDGASDIHVEPGRSKSRIRFRIDGVLYEVMTPRIELHPAIVSRLKVMANLDIAERRLPQDGRIQVFSQQRCIDLRFSSLPGLYGEKVVLRVLDKNQAILDVNKLGMTNANLATYLNLLDKSHGLILVTGPTGSGKTTSLYAALNHLNSLEKSIVTIEDPVEYQIDVINQNEVRDKIGLGFAKVLRHVLRQDPDIVMVGEIRDTETATIAVQAALTGHLVLSTLHTNDSIGAVTRMIDMGVEPYLLSSALIGVMAQRLVRTICPACKTSFLAQPEVLKQYGWEGDSVTLSRGRGCGECYDSGYKGRIAIHELIKADNNLQKLIMKNSSRDELTEYLVDADVQTLFRDGLGRVREGKTTIEEISRVITS
ncbi:MAG: ATPase, T2SS/T4P/T4SS family [Gammaproteobacteria bacterium]|nr:ATPase, T2SS/T4P/T4SS family [Gammaproteobacteria bacterium]